MFRPKTQILAIVIVAAILRIFYAMDVPLSGDEALGLLKASGQAVGYEDRLGEENVPISEIKKFVSYSKGFSVRDVLGSLRHRGMHPPFYYLGLHYVLKYIGGGGFTLRLISIFLSLLCVVYIYRLGRAVYDENVGLCSAFLLAISTYGVMYGAMVRPYPLAMLICLISTLQAYELSTADELRFSNKKLFLYAITVLIGLYTIYHFVFVFVFQTVFLAISNLRKKKSLLIIIAITAIIFVLYLPWVPSLLDQLRKVRGDQYYFHGKISLLSFAECVIRINFATRGSAGPLVIIKILIAAMIYTIILIGCYFSLRDKTRRLFILALAVYLLSWYAADRMLNTQTLTVGKLLFFVIPISLMLLAAGIPRITERYRIRTIFIVLCCGLLLGKSIAMCIYKPGFDGPWYLRPFRDSIGKSLASNQKGFVIINTTKPRFLLSFVHAIKIPVDMKVMHANNVESELPRIRNLENYDFVFVTNCYVHYEKQSFYSYADIKDISNYLSKYGFRLKEPSELEHEAGKSSLHIFGKGVP